MLLMQVDHKIIYFSFKQVRVDERDFPDRLDHRGVRNFPLPSNGAEIRGFRGDGPDSVGGFRSCQYDGSLVLRRTGDDDPQVRW